MTGSTLLDLVLEPGQLSVLFQPIARIVSGEQKIWAVEALIRGPHGTNLEPADVLFEYVRRKREESSVDRACIATIIAAASGIPARFAISINVHASTLGRDHAFVDFVFNLTERYGVEPTRLIFEILEHTPFWDGRSFLVALAHLRARGSAIALDDIGLGHANYRMILECRPDYFKVDRYLVQDCDTDPYRRAVLLSVSQLASAFHASVIAEGVESESQVQTLNALGIHFIQGYFVARPQPAADLRLLLDASHSLETAVAAKES